MYKEGATPTRGSQEYSAGKYWTREEDQILVENKWNPWSAWNELDVAGYKRGLQSVRCRLWKLGNAQYNLDDMKYYAKA